MTLAASTLDASLDAAFAAHTADPFGLSGAHLAAYSFRFDTAAAVADDLDLAPRGDVWTLAETFAEITRRDARLSATSRGLRLAHAHRLPDLARAVALHADALTMWVRVGLDRDAPARLSARYVPFGAAAWDEPTRLHAAWFVRRFEAPAGPLALRPGVSVTDVAAFRASVVGRLAAGPGAAGAPGLRTDLAALFARYAAVPAEAPAPAYARAA